LDPETRYNLGVLLAEQGDSDAAMKLFGQAIAMKPDYARAYYNLGIVHGRHARVTEALACFARVVELETPQSELAISARRNIGVGLAQVGRSAEAAVQYRQLLALKGDDWATLNLLAWLLSTTPKAELANGAQALTNYAMPHLVDTLGAAHAACGQFEQAAAFAARAGEMFDKAGQAELAAKARSRVRLYQARQPFREYLGPQ